MSDPWLYSTVQWPQPPPLQPEQELAQTFDKVTFGKMTECSALGAFFGAFL